MQTRIGAWLNCDLVVLTVWAIGISSVAILAVKMRGPRPDETARSRAAASGIFLSVKRL